MMKTLIHCAFLLSTLLLYQCGGRAALSAQTDEIAKELCRCVESLAQSLQGLEQASANQDSLAQEAAIAAWEEGMMISEACLDALEARHGAQLEKEEQAIREAMNRFCPEVVRIMNQADQLMEFE
jgi:exonuclease VII small subunit